MTAQMVLYRPISLIHRNVGIRPPSKYIVNMQMNSIALCSRSLPIDSGYAHRIVTTTEITVPSTI